MNIKSIYSISSKILLLLGIVSLSLSCAKGPAGETELGSPVTFSSSLVESKAPQDVWSVGDKIGVFMLEQNSSNVIRSYANRSHTTTTVTGSFIADTGHEMFYPSGQKVDFVAYHPYNAATTGMLFPIDLTDQDHREWTDLLWSNEAKGLDPQTRNVPLQFRHAMSKVVVVAVPSAWYDIYSTAGVLFTVKSNKLTGNFNLYTGEFQPDTESEHEFICDRRDGQFGHKVIEGEDGPRSSIEFVLPPQTFDAGDLKMEFTLFSITQDAFTWECPQDERFEAGKEYLYKISFSKKGIESVLCEIRDWEVEPERILEKTNEYNTIPVIPGIQIPVANIPAGSFYMGSPDSEANRSITEPQHRVTLTQDFYMGKYEVTNAQFAAFLNHPAAQITVKKDPLSDTPNIFIAEGPVTYFNGTTMVTEIRPLAFSSDGLEIHNFGLNWDGNQWKPAQPGYEDHPVVYVTWWGAKAFADWVTQTSGITCQLPTEAQWEYACRGEYPNKGEATDTHPYALGDGFALVRENANISNGHGITSAVGSYPPNNYGLYDMHGNVWEWTLDYYDESYGLDDLSETVMDPLNTNSRNVARVMRGGAFPHVIEVCRSASRYQQGMDGKYFTFGFRVMFQP